MKSIYCRIEIVACVAAVAMTFFEPPVIAAQTLEQLTRINTDERVVFFPTAARLGEDGKTWSVPIHGWVFEPEQNDFLRLIALRRLRTALELDPAAATTKTFDRRVRLFLVDNERRKRIRIRVGTQQHTLPASNTDGHFTTTLELAAETVEALAEAGRLPFQAVTAPGDDREFAGLVHLIPPTGISVISDVDDTLKITDVADRKKLVDNIFFQPFLPVEGMADLYRRWADRGAEFHFVSASPWQLYETLRRFFNDAGLPEATYHLNPFRLTGRPFAQMFENPLETKRLVIEQLLEDYPKRQFILVGDSGQQDPELYGRLARTYTDQVVGICIRELGERDDPVRYRRAFREIDRETWRTFRDPARLTSFDRTIRREPR